MKLIGRILIVLLAALIVVTAAIGFSQTSYADTLTPTIPTGARTEALTSLSATVSSDEAGAALATSERTRPPVGEGHHDDGHAGGLFGAVDIATNLGIIGLIVGLVALAPMGVKRLRKRPAVRPTTADPASPGDE